MPHFMNNGVRINYLVAGSGRPLVLLHGALASHKVWVNQLKELSKRYRIVAMDFRGHGDSDKPSSGYNHTNMVRDVELLMDNLGIDRAVVVGSSMGGVIAQTFCLTHPRRVEALVLVGTLSRPVWSGRIAEYARERVSQSPEEGARSWFTPTSKEEFIRLAVEESRKVSMDFHRNVSYEVGEYDLRPRLREIKVPTLILVGEEDVVTPVQESETIHSLIRHSELKVFPNCGHLVMLERSEEFNELLIDFLKKHLHGISRHPTGERRIRLHDSKITSRKSEAHGV